MRMRGLPSRAEELREMDGGSQNCHCVPRQTGGLRWGSGSCTTRGSRLVAQSGRSAGGRCGSARRDDNSPTAHLGDVAELAGVSPMTASRALNNERYVSEGAAAKVREAARQLGFVPHHGAAVSPRIVLTRSGSSFPMAGEQFFDDPNIAPILAGASAELAELGSQLIVLIAGNDYQARQGPTVRPRTSRRRRRDHLTGDHPGCRNRPDPRRRSTCSHRHHCSNDPVWTWSTSTQRARSVVPPIIS